MRTEPYRNEQNQFDVQPHNGHVPYSTLKDSDLEYMSPMMPEKQFRDLPINVKDQTCHCIYPRWDRRIHPKGTWCVECSRPHRFTTYLVMQLCEGCDTYYVPGILEQFPPRYKLCTKCDKPVRPRRGRSV